MNITLSCKQINMKMMEKSKYFSGVKGACYFSLKSLTHLRRKIVKALIIRHSQIFAFSESLVIFMFSSIQRANAVAGILTAASCLLMCSCSCLIKKFCLVQHHLLSPFLYSSKTAVCQRETRDIHQYILGS